MDFYWLKDIVLPVIDVIDKPGSGGIVFAIVLGTASLIYFLSTRWILSGQDNGTENT